MLVLFCVTYLAYCSRLQQSVPVGVSVDAYPARGRLGERMLGPYVTRRMLERAVGKLDPLAEGRPVDGAAPVCAVGLGIAPSHLLLPAPGGILDGAHAGTAGLERLHPDFGRWDRDAVPRGLDRERQFGKRLSGREGRDKQRRKRPPHAELLRKVGGGIPSRVGVGR